MFFSLFQILYNAAKCFRRFARTKPLETFNDFTEQFQDGPVFDRSTKDFVAYAMVVPSRHKISLVYEDLKSFDKELRAFQTSISGNPKLPSGKIRC